MAWKDRLAGRSGQQVLTGANFALYTLIVIALIVLVNWFVSNHDKRWDMTPNKKYSLSEQTRKMLKDLDQDVTIYVFDRKESSGEHHDVLDMYTTASHRVKVKYLDPRREPTLTKEFGVHSYGTVILAAGDRHYEAQSPTEEGITNALIHVLTGQKTIYFTQGHGEHDPASSDDMGYSSAKQQMENENFQVKTVSLAEKNEVPSDCTVLIIAGPQKDFLAQEVDAIRKYVTAGGRILVLLDALADPRMEKPENLEKMLAEWNVTTQSDLVIDPSVRIVGAGPGLTIVRSYGTSPIVKPLEGSMTIFPLAISFEIGKEPKPGVTDDWLCQTSDSGYGVADFNPKMQDVTFRKGKDLKGPMTLAVAGTVSGADEGKQPLSTTGKSAEGRFVAIGTSALAANAYLHVRQFSNLRPAYGFG